MAHVLIIKSEFLHTAPAGLRQYVEEWFRPMQILGQDVMVATRCANSDEYRQGVAPSHNVETRRYSDGLPPNMILNDFIRDKVKEGLYMWEFYGGDDPHRPYGWDDD